MKKESEIRVLMVEPNEHPKEYLLENTLSAMQAAVGGLIDIVGLEDNICILLNCNVAVRMAKKRGWKKY